MLFAWTSWRRLRRHRACALGGVLLSAWLPASAAAGRPNPKLPQPAAVIQLAPLGFQPIQARYLAAGASMYTVAFVDNEHLLVTFNTRALMRRAQGEPADDDDRSVAALLLELPSGKVLARTIWRTHDHGRYLWPLGHGRFLLRVRTQLSVLQPLAGLAAGDAFHEEPFYDPKRRIGFIYVAPAGDVLGLETLPEPDPPLFGAAAAAVALAAVSPDAPKPPPRPKPVDTDSAVQITLFRMHEEPGATASAAGRLVFERAGYLRADGLIHLNPTGAGYLATTKASSQGYAFDFESHAGKKLPLGVFDTSCAPRTYWLSQSEFVAFGCLGSEDRHSLSEFDLRGQEPWIASLPGTLFAPIIDPAPAAGRFAFSHVVVASASFNTDNITPDELTRQEITVYQNYDGRTLFKTVATPIQSAGQNFDLSPDGLALAVFRDQSIEVTRLPPLTGKDEHELKLAREADPPPSGGAMLLSSVPVANRPANAPVVVDTQQSADARVVGDPEPSTAPAPVVDRGSQRAQVTDADANIVGDVPAGAPRKPPSLYDADHPKPAKPQ